MWFRGLLTETWTYGLEIDHSLSLLGIFSNNPLRLKGRLHLWLQGSGRSVRCEEIWFWQLNNPALFMARWMERCLVVQSRQIFIEVE